MAMEVRDRYVEAVQCEYTRHFRAQKSALHKMQVREHSAVRFAA